MSKISNVHDTGFTVFYSGLIYGLQGQTGVIAEIKKTAFFMISAGLFLLIFSAKDLDIRNDQRHYWPLI